MMLTPEQSEQLMIYQKGVSGLKNRKNFASSSSGAAVLSSSPGIVNRGAVLKSDEDQYLTVSECNSSQTETLVINLSDDVLIDTILVTNREDFSSQLGVIAFYGSIDYPPQDEKWSYIGSLNPEQSQLQGHIGQHLLSLEQHSRTLEAETNAQNNQQHHSGLVRYLKVQMTGHERNDNGLYCTLTRMQVYGSSMHQVVRDISLDLIHPHPVQTMDAQSHAYAQQKRSLGISQPELEDTESVEILTSARVTDKSYFDGKEWYATD